MKKITTSLAITLLFGILTIAHASAIPGDEYAPESISMTWKKF